MAPRRPETESGGRAAAAVDTDDRLGGRTKAPRRTGHLVLLALALAAFGIAAWAEREQRHSHRWTIAGDRFHLTSFLAPWHHHTREVPWSGINRITGEPHPDQPELTILTLHYGPVAFRMPSQNDRDIRRFGRYVEHLQRLLEAAKAGDTEATVLSLDPYLVVTTTAAFVSMTAWLTLFALLVRRLPTDRR